VLRADPYTGKLVASVAVAGLNEFINGLAEPSIDTLEVTIDADEAAPEARLVPDVVAVDDVMVVNDDSGDDDDVDDAIEDARPCKALGIAAEVSGDTVWTPVPAEVPAACVTAAAKPTTPDELVVCGGGGGGVNVDAADDAAA
jgi:hypothetical protein